MEGRRRKPLRRIEEGDDVVTAEVDQDNLERDRSERMKDECGISSLTSPSKDIANVQEYGAQKEGMDCTASEQGCGLTKEIDFEHESAEEQVRLVRTAGKNVQGCKKKLKGETHATMKMMEDEVVTNVKKRKTRGSCGRQPLQSADAKQTPFCSEESRVVRPNSNSSSTILKSTGMEESPAMVVMGIPGNSLPSDDHQHLGKTRSRLCGRQQSYPSLPECALEFETDLSNEASHDISINCLPNGCLLRIMKLVAQIDGRAPRLVLPLVCKRWANVLKAPSEVWETIVVDESGHVDPARVKEWFRQRTPVLHLHFKRATYKGIDASSGHVQTRSMDVSQFDPDTIRQLQSISSRDPEFINVNHLAELTLAAPNLQKLDLYSLTEPLPSKAMDAIQELPKLKSLTLQFSGHMQEHFVGAGGALPQSFFKMTQLESLSLDCPSLRGIQPTLARMKQLQILEMKNLLHLPVLPLMTVHLNRIQKLSFPGCQSLFATGRQDGPVEPGAERMWWMIRSFPNLECLDLTACGLTEIPVVEGMPANTTLQKLVINDNPEMMMKKGLAAFQGLKELSMKNCNMPCVSSAVLALSQLTCLDISANGMVECSGLHKLTKLKSLTATDNSFPSIPKDVYFLSNLEVVDLRNNIYLEVAAPLTVLCSKLPKLNMFCVSKGTKGRFQTSSIEWLHALDKEYHDVHGRSGVIRYDDDGLSSHE